MALTLEEKRYNHLLEMRTHLSAAVDEMREIYKLGADSPAFDLTLFTTLCAFQIGLDEELRLLAGRYNRTEKR